MTYCVGSAKGRHQHPSKESKGLRTRAFRDGIPEPRDERSFVEERAGSVWGGAGGGEGGRLGEDGHPGDEDGEEGVPRYGRARHEGDRGIDAPQGAWVPRCPHDVAVGGIPFELRVFVVEGVERTRGCVVIWEEVDIDGGLGEFYGVEVGEGFCGRWGQAGRVA